MWWGFAIYIRADLGSQTVRKSQLWHRAVTRDSPLNDTQTDKAFFPCTFSFFPTNLSAVWVWKKNTVTVASGWEAFASLCFLLRPILRIVHLAVTPPPLHPHLLRPAGDWQAGIRVVIRTISFQQSSRQGLTSELWLSLTQLFFRALALRLYRSGPLGELIPSNLRAGPSTLT